MPKDRRLLFWTVLGFLILALVGCKKQAQPQEQETAPAPPQEEATAAPAATQAEGERIVLRVWGHQNVAFNESDQAILKAFMEAHPDVELKYETFPWDVFMQTLQAAIPAGEAADVIILPGGNTCRFALGGQLLEVPATVLSMDNRYEPFFPAPIDAQVCDGQLYGLPKEFNLEYGGAYVNQTYFEEAGLAYPPRWETWDEVVEDAKKLVQYDAEGNMSVAGLHFVNTDQLYTYFLAGILEQGSEYFAEDGVHFVFNSPEAIRTIQKMVDMVQRDQVVDPVIFGENEWVGTSFAQGRVAIAILGSWFAGTAKLTYPDLAFDYVSLPPFMGPEPRFTSVGGWAVVVTKTTQHPEIAWEVARFMTMEHENALLFNSKTATVPALRSVAEDARLVEAAPVLQAVLPILEYGRYQGDLTDPHQLQFDIIVPNLMDALRGLITPEEAAQNIHDEANAMVDQARR